MPCHQSVVHLLLHDGVGLAMSCFRVSTIMCCNHYPLAQLASEAGQLMSVWPSTRCYTSGRADQPLYPQFISQHVLSRVVQLVELLPCNCSAVLRGSSHEIDVSWQETPLSQAYALQSAVQAQLPSAHHHVMHVSLHAAMALARMTYTARSVPMLHLT